MVAPRSGDKKVSDPYKLLPPIFTEAELEAIEPMLNASEIAEGGTAMIQFTEMTEAESTKIQNALLKLKYCELDTFAMVLIYEYWRNLIDAQSEEPTAA